MANTLHISDWDSSAAREFLPPEWFAWDFFSFILFIAPTNWYWLSMSILTKALNWSEKRDGGDTAVDFD